VAEFPFHESGSVDPAVLRRVEGRDVYLAGVRTDLPKVRYTYVDPQFSAMADGATVFVETGCRIEVPGTIQGRPELVYRNILVYKISVESGLVTRLVTYHNPVAALVFHTDRSLPTSEQIADLGRPT
jgi:hypothetical protein